MFLISDNVDTKAGMRLAGIDGVVVHERQEIIDALNMAIQDETIGIILITELLAEQVPEVISQYKLSGIDALIVEVPDRHGTRRSIDSIMHYVNEAIGLKL
jgi:V/A-type H+-transporting ATPase subunit F